MKKYKVAIVGYGKMGKIRAQSVKNRSDLEIVAVCDVYPANNESEYPFFSDYKELASFDLDIVFVCTVNKYLPDIVCYFLNNKVNVFCEKPPGRCKEDVAQMLAAEKNNPEVKLKFGFNHRYHQAVLDAKAIVEKGRLGKILWMRGVYGKGGGNQYESNWRNDKELSGGGILIDQGIHMVDLFRFFCGEFEEIKAFIETSHWPIKVEDNAFVMLRNKQKQVAMLHSSATQWQYKFSLEIYLEKGYATISGILSSTMNYGTETLKVARCLYDKEGYPMPNPEESMTYYDEDHSWKRELGEFMDCVQNDCLIKVGSCQEAYQTMDLIERIYAADNTWS